MCFNHLLNPCPTPTPAVTKWLRQIPSAGAPLPKAALFMPSSEHGSSSYTLAICLDVDSEPSPLLFLPHLSLGLGKQHTLSLYLSPWLHPPRHTSTPFFLQVSYLPEVLTRHQVTIFPHVVYVRAETLFPTQHQTSAPSRKWTAPAVEGIRPSSVFSLFSSVFSLFSPLLALEPPHLILLSSGSPSPLFRALTAVPVLCQD